MAKLVYRPGEGDPAVVAWRGFAFEAGKAVTVSDVPTIVAAQGNKHFDVFDFGGAGELEDAKRFLISLREQGHAMDQRQFNESKLLDIRHREEADDFSHRTSEMLAEALEIIAKHQPVVVDEPQPAAVVAEPKPEPKPKPAKQVEPA